jgi:hypothetical protein
MASNSQPPSLLPSGLVSDHLPLIDCECCQNKIICLRSRAGKVFYKCPSNIRGAANTDTLDSIPFEMGFEGRFVCLVL